MFAFDFFIENLCVKWDKAVANCEETGTRCLTFYDFPAEHWKHIRTSNPSERHFRHRPAPHETHQRMSQPARPGLAMASS